MAVAQPGQVGRVRAAWRLARGLACVAQGLATCAVLFPFLDLDGRTRRVRAFSLRMLRALGVRLAVEGTAQPGPVMLVANHVSWLDILAINAAHTARFVSKAEIRHWPLLGWMVQCGGTLFIERARKRDAMRVVHQVSAALSAGDVVAVFPEGTTGDGRGLLPFHANLIQAAVALDAPVQGVALRYADDAAAVSAAAAYTGDITLWRSLWAVVHARGLVARVTLLAPERSGGRERRAFCEGIRTRIAQALEGTAP